MSGWAGAHTQRTSADSKVHIRAVFTICAVACAVEIDIWRGHLVQDELEAAGLEPRAL